MPRYLQHHRNTEGEELGFPEGEVNLNSEFRTGLPFSHLGHSLHTTKPVRRFRLGHAPGTWLTKPARPSLR
jgi:hypothetical protein